MNIEKSRRRGLVRAAIVVMLAGLVGACADQSGEPAPVYLKGGAPMAAAPPPPRQIVVQRGQTLDALARAYHVPVGAIIAANGLKPPYRLQAGAHLTIPNAGPPPMQQAMAPAAPSAAVAATPLPPPQPTSLMPPPAVPPQQAAPPPMAARGSPDVIPLDGPLPPRPAAAPATLTPPSQPAAAPVTAGAPPPVLPPRNAAAALPLPGEATPAAAPADVGVAASAGRFPWPVHGRVLANYGSSVGGGRNDGINIAAPKGTPVHAIDGGTVAYAGNEVKGYGNLVLIRHDNGWISAYAHLDGVTVKPGDKVAAGQSFAKVGDSGGVGEPQLHFELRRGKKPVDPREFLAPAPSAAGVVGNPAG
jgi:murein DD-endopeptidase MepM/ murein hydrolase activator NlpD